MIVCKSFILGFVHSVVDDCLVLLFTDSVLSDLEIVGFIEIGDIASPPVVSRHLVLPIAVNKGESLC